MPPILPPPNITAGLERAREPTVYSPTGITTKRNRAPSGKVTQRQAPPLAEPGWHRRDHDGYAEITERIQATTASEKGARRKIPGTRAAKARKTLASPSKAELPSHPRRRGEKGLPTA